MESFMKSVKLVLLLTLSFVFLGQNIFSNNERKIASMDCINCEGSIHSNSSSITKAVEVIEKVVPYGKVGENELKCKIVGQLTLKGVTKTVKMEASIFEYDTSYSISARLKLDRSDYNIKYGSGTFFEEIGDKVIYDDVLLDVSLSARK